MKYATAVIAVCGVAQANYRSGSVSSYEKFTYGKFVTRMKAPDKKGTVSSFFTYWDGPNFKPSEWNELDIEIVPSVEHNPMSMNVIYGDGSDKNESHQYAHSFNPRDDWHTYTMEWTPDYISWSIDDVEVRHLKGDDPAVERMGKEQSLRMNFWTPTFESWGHGLDAKDMPWYLLYDYVEVFTWDPETNQFDLHWRDDFNSFDERRWHKASGGFDSNSSVFHPDNVSVKAGNLVLKMEPERESHSRVPKEHHSAPKHHGHYKSARFDREQARAKKSEDDERFWIGQGKSEETQSHHKKKDKHHKKEKKHHPKHEQKPQKEEEPKFSFQPYDVEDSSSDSESDWQEYQAYLRGYNNAEPVAEEKPAKKEAPKPA